MIDFNIIFLRVREGGFVRKVSLIEADLRFIDDFFVFFRLLDGFFYFRGIKMFF